MIDYFYKSNVFNKKHDKKNIVAIIFSFLLGGIICSSVGVYALTQIMASAIGYDNTSSNLTSTNVQGAINELETKANNWLNPESYGMSMVPSKNIILFNEGLIFRKDGQTYLVRNNNYEQEKIHIQEIFEGGSCSNFLESIRVDGYGCTNNDGLTIYVSTNGGLFAREGNYRCMMNIPYLSGVSEGCSMSD